jgi:hypothetical protein
MTAIHVAEARRGDRIRAINRSIASLEQQAAQGAFSAADSYMATHAKWCRGEVENLKAEIERLGNLSADDLVAMFCPEVAREAAVQKDMAENGPNRVGPGRAWCARKPPGCR